MDMPISALVEPSLVDERYGNRSHDTGKVVIGIQRRRAVIAYVFLPAEESEHLSMPAVVL